MELLQTPGADSSALEIALKMNFLTDGVVDMILEIGLFVSVSHCIFQIGKI